MNRKDEIREKLDSVEDMLEVFPDLTDKQAHYLIEINVVILDTILPEEITKGIDG